jgi:hypothetical protein
MSTRRQKHELSTPPPIRITNTRTKRTTIASGGKDAAAILKVELDRRTGLELAAEEDQAHREQVPAAIMLAAGAGKAS